MIIVVSIIFIIVWSGKLWYTKQKQHHLKQFKRFCLLCSCSYVSTAKHCPICHMKKRNIFERFKKWKNKDML